MVYKGLCRMGTLSFRVAFTGSVQESLSLSTKSQGRFKRPRCFLVLHSELFYLWYKGLCRMKSLVFRNCSLIWAGVRHLVLHHEPFFFLRKGLRFLLRLDNY